MSKVLSLHLGTRVCRQNHWWSESRLRRKDANKSTNCNWFQNDLRVLNGGCLPTDRELARMQLLLLPRESSFIAALILSHTLGPFFFLFSIFFSTPETYLSIVISMKKKKGMEGNHRIMGCERAEHLVTLPMQPGVWESGWSHLAQRSKNMYSDGKKRQSNSRRVMQPDVIRKSGQYVLRRGSGKTPLLVYNHNAHHIVWSLILCPGTCYFMLYSTYLI